jgi:uncharacterized protein YggT (Ycf19 family)
MNPGSALVRTLLVTLNVVFEIIQWLIFIWVILSWILFFTSQSSFRWRRRGVYNAIAQLHEIFSRAASPLLRPFRRLLPAWKTGGIDWSPMLLLLVIFAIRYFLALVIV